MNDQQIERYFLGLLALYTFFGFYGTLWISDEFDAERAAFYGFFAVPWAIYFFLRALLRPQWRLEYGPSYYLSALVLVAAYSWGNFLALNAASSQNQALVNITLNNGVYAMTHHRGGFDWLYKPRW